MADYPQFEIGDCSVDIIITIFSNKSTIIRIVFE